MTQSQSLRTEVPAILVISARQEDFTENQFALLADILAESWSNAAARWTEINNSPLTFDAVMKATTDEQRNKLRKLYRSTY